VYNATLAVTVILHEELPIYLKNVIKMNKQMKVLNAKRIPKI
jgi:hypothetical protein